MISVMWARLVFKKRTILRPITKMSARGQQEKQSNGRIFLKLSICRKTVTVDPSRLKRRAQVGNLGNIRLQFQESQSP